MRELECVREQVLEHLLQATAVGVDRRRKIGVHIDAEIEALLVRDCVEVVLDEILDLRQANVSGIDVHLAGLDLRQVEHVVDEIEQVAARRENRLRELDLLRTEIAFLVLGQQPRENQQTVQRGPQLVRHVGEELRLVLRAQRQLLCFLLESQSRRFHFLVLRLDLPVLLGEK